MMYHFMLGLGASIACALSAVPSGGVAVAVVGSVLVSSAIKSFQPDAAGRHLNFLLTVEELQQVTHSKLNHIIDYVEEGRKYEHCNHDDGGSRLNLLAIRIVDLLHLGTNFFDEVLRAIRPSLHPIADAIFVSHCRSLCSSDLGTTHVKPASFFAPE